MKRISLVILVCIAAISTAVFAGYLAFAAAEPFYIASRRECVELYAACLTESVIFAFISELIFAKG